LPIYRLKVYVYSLFCGSTQPFIHDVFYRLQGGRNMTVSAILNGKNNNRKNNQLIRPVQTVKRGSKTDAVECSYQLLQQQAIMVYQR